MQKRRTIALVMSSFLLVSLLLVACGDATPQTLPILTPINFGSTATSNPAATAAANTTIAITTSTAAPTIAGTPTTAANRPVVTSAPILANSISLKLRNTTPAQFGHTDIITAIAYSPDGKMFASASRDSTIKLWDSATNKEVKTLYGHTRGIRKIAFSPDGKVLASIGSDNKLLLWNLATGSSSIAFDKTDFKRPISFSADGKTLAVTDVVGVVQLVDTTSGKAKPYPNKMQFIIFSPDGKTRAVVNYEKGIVLEPANGGTRIQEFSASDIVNDLAFSQDGTNIAAATDSGVEIWETSTGQRTGNFEDSSPVDYEEVKFSPDGKSLLTISDKSAILILSVPDGKVLDQAAGITSVEAASFSPDGTTLALGLSDPTIALLKLAGSKLADLKVNKPVLLEGSEYYPSRLTFSADGKTILAGKGGFDKYIQQLDPATAKLTVILNEASLYLNPFAFSPDAKLVASLRSIKELSLVDTATGKTLLAIKTSTITGATDPSFSGPIAFTPDGKTLITGHYGSDVRVWEVATGKLLYTLSGHKESISAIAVSSDGQMVASGDRKGEVRIWQVATGKLATNLQGQTEKIYSLAFSPDSTKLLSGAAGLAYFGEAQLKSWEISSGKELANLKKTDLGVDGLVYLPGGRFVITIGEDSYIRILNSATLKEVSNIPSSQIAKAKALSLSPDGKLLVTAHVDGSIKLWDIVSK